MLLRQGLIMIYNFLPLDKAGTFNLKVEPSKYVQKTYHENDQICPTLVYISLNWGPNLTSTAHILTLTQYFSEYNSTS